MMASNLTERQPNLAEFILARIGFREGIAQIDAKSGRYLTYREIFWLANKMAIRILQADIEPGEVIAVFSENCLEYAGVILGILKAECTAALNSPTLTPSELLYSLSITKPGAIYAPNVNVDHLRDLIKPYYPQIKILTWSLDDFMNDEEAIIAVRDTTISIKAFLLSSSGSTGLPKAVCIGHSNMISALHNLSGAFMKEGEAALGLMPFFHAYGLGLLLMALCKGSPYVIMSKFTPADFSAAINTYGVKRLHLVPSLIKKLANGTIDPMCLRSISAIYSGAGAVILQDQFIVKDMLPPGAKMYHSYGMTETTHVVCIGEVEPDKPGSSGRMLSCIQAKLVGENGETISGGMGELYLKGPFVTYLGYHNNEEATKEMFDSDNWLKTGDLAIINKDGYVFIIDRIKDIIKCNGHQVSATELEQVISTQTGVSEVAVVGVSHEKYGEVPRAFIVPDEKEKPSAEKIKEVVKKKLSHYKWLRGGIRFVESLPKTDSMKIIRKQLREMK